MTLEQNNKDLSAVIISADNGDPEACDIINKLFDNGLSESDFVELRKNAYIPLANEGNPYAMYIMGHLTRDNTNISYEWYLKSANSGYTPAMLKLGLGYTRMLNSNYPDDSYGYNNEKAKQWFFKALNLGDSEGARLYAEWCCENDPREQEEYLLKAIKMNNWEALANYGDFFYLSPDNKDNQYNEKAKSLYIEAAKSCTERKYLSKFGEICYNLGHIFGAKVMVYPAETESDINDGINAIKWLCCALYANEEHQECLDLACTIADNCNIAEFNGDYYIKICEILDNIFND